MLGRMLAALLLCSPIVFADPPATQPATQPAKFPTPAELIEQWKKDEAEDDTKTKVAYFELSGAIAENPSLFSLFGSGGEAQSLRSLVDRIHKARLDDEVKAALVTIGADLTVGLAQAQEIRDALIELRGSGKKVFVYADSYDTVSYTIASGCSNVCLLEAGEVMIPGIGFETMFYKGAMEKVGLKGDYIQIGEFKGAEEPYTRTAPSDELRGELTRLADALFEQIVGGIATSRNVAPDKVRQLVDDTMVDATSAKQRGFVDHLVDQDGLRKLITDSLKQGEINLVHKYGEEAKAAVDFSNPFSLLAMMSEKPKKATKPEIALIYASGVIVDGDGGADLFSMGEDNVGSEPMRKAFRTAARDENIKAVVIRIDSPGGSALASEVMWQAARRVSQEAKKPVIISVGGMAASGGYYLACGGDYIFADSSAIVGSIGVVGGKIVMKGLFDWIGLGTESFTRGKNAALFSSTEPWTDAQRDLIRKWMTRTYDQFTQRVLTTRGNKIADIDKVARGRIFTAAQAKELGMVDELGGLRAALAYTAKKAGLSDDGYEIRVLPAPKTLADLLGGGSSDAALPFAPSIGVAPDSVLRALSPDQTRQLSRQFTMMQLMHRRPVILLSPWVMTHR